MSDYSDPDVDAIVGAVHRLSKRRHDVAAALAVALHEAGAAYPSREDLFGQFDDVDDNRYVLDLMNVGSRYTRAHLAQFQVQAMLESRYGEPMSLDEVAAGIDVPEAVAMAGMGAEVACEQAAQVSPTTWRVIGS